MREEKIDFQQCTNAFLKCGNPKRPVIRSHYGNGFIKQYVRDHVDLRTEPASNNVTG
jgi:hypothetical protein